ncbi:hypothetical protein CJF42_15645 [Pseudoalteromonas sp. NBT06-2]|uniref:bifunctional diguanylate cyclase/phosphodiesterase n=1 Tax=Pseudoalteromonas sp. NBT06-2 TaxID=2025950 RepID=UPI000BA7A2B5|nr:EAL domain-containing protein [Pseudoalteromonas sp. NBT06-2]PAJ73486.1 hypothetical protein CJF42_15645 [Pseudoalteromonas sp. NBT06-2]
MPDKSKRGTSLKTQIYGLVIFLGIISFICSLLISVEHTKDYLNEQMGSHAQDTATSLGLSISPYLDEENIIIAETMVSAIFDSGYYAAMEFTTIEGDALISRHNPNQVETVPTWFIDMFALFPPVRSSEISNGWQIVGNLSVTSHAGVSYFQLWQYASKAFIAFSFILLFSLAIAYFILSAVLKPLAMVEHQAICVSKKQFILNPEKPFTRELKVVIEALNSMVSNVQKNFDSMTRQAERITKEAYLDKLTGLGNRRAFESQFNASLSDISDDESATIALIELPSLQKVNNESGYQAGDKYVLSVVNELKNAFIEIENTKIYRINGGSFIITIAQCTSLCQNEIKTLNNQFLSLERSHSSDNFAKLVATPYQNTDSMKKLLIDLDNLITQDSTQLKIKKAIFTENSGLSLGLQDWKNLIKNIMNTGHIQFLYQPVKDINNINTLYDELLAKFYFEDKIIPNNQLFSMAERLKLTQELDIKLITNAINFVSNDLDNKLAINLSQQSLFSTSFNLWLKNFLNENEHCRDRLIFEINETALLKDIELATKNINLFKTLGINICIERFGTSFTSFKYLRGLDLDFIKLDGSYIKDLLNHTENNYYIQAVNQICHSLGIKVIACHIESDEVLNLIKELECDACQGQYIQKPTELI